MAVPRQWDSHYARISEVAMSEVAMTISDLPSRLYPSCSYSSMLRRQLGLCGFTLRLVAVQSIGIDALPGCPPVIHMRCHTVAVVSRPGTGLTGTELCVHSRHEPCRGVTGPAADVEKWTPGVDNVRGLGIRARRTVDVLGTTYARLGSSQGVCVDWHTPGPAGMGQGWGDVDRLSTARTAGNPRRCVDFGSYPHAPHHYDKDGLSLSPHD
jgi:hypothetical protein